MRYFERINVKFNQLNFSKVERKSSNPLSIQYLL